METTGVPRLGAGAGGSGGDVVPEVIVVGACDGFGRVVALVGALLGELAGLSLDSAGRGMLRGVVAALARVRAGADAAEARVAGALERLDDGGLDVVEVLRRNTGSSQREARRRWRRARALAQMPNVARALAAGDISTEHAEALARAAAATSAEVVDGDAELLAQVAGVPADRAGRYIEAWTQRHHDPFDLQAQHLRQRRRRRLNFGDGEDGMLMAHAAFDRVLGAQFRSLINGIADRIWRAEGGRDNPNSRSAEQRRLDALAIAVGLQPAPAAAVAREPAGRAGAVAREPARRAEAVAPEPAGREPAGREPAGQPRPLPGEEPAPVTPREPRPQPADDPVPLAPRGPGSQPGEEPAPATPREPGSQPGEEPAPATPREPGPLPGDEPVPATPREPGPQPREEPVPATPREPGSQPGEEPAPATPREPGPLPGNEPMPVTPREPGPQPRDEPMPVTPREPGPQPREEPVPVTPREPGPQPAAGPVVVPPRHQVVIVASTDVISGRDPQGRCEIPGVGPIPLSELERLACDAELFGVLFSSDGEPLWHGRGERTATDAQRRALVARDGGCVLCADEPARCEAHHVKPWAKPSEGPTDIDNLALLCGTCHRRLHNHGRVLRRGPDGTWGTAPDPRFTGRRKRVRSPGNGVRRAAASETSACRSAVLEMTMKVGAQCLPQDVGRTSWDGNHRSRPASGPAVASHLGRETTAVGTGRRPGGKQRPRGGRPP